MDIDDNLLNQELVNIAMEESFLSAYDDTHIFIVGRGRKLVNGYLNLPENKLLSEMGIYVDPNPAVEPDIIDCIENINITQYIDNKKIKIIFDYSTFYCSAMPNMLSLAHKIKKPFTILVPLYKDEKKIPSDIIQCLREKIFKIKMVAGEYPLFDFSETFSQFGKMKQVENIINKNNYIEIDVVISKK